MYGRFVGLDIGRNDVRISLIKKGLRDVQLLQTIHSYFSDLSQEPLDSISNIFKEHSLPKGDVAVSLSEDPTSMRVIRFPFADSKKIDQVYGYELENISTFDPGEKVHGYHLVKTGSGSEALVCVYEKENVSELLDFFNKSGIDPKVVTSTPIAFGALNEILEGERPLLLIDMGDREINFSLFDNDGLKRVRSSTKAMHAFIGNLSGVTGLPEGEIGLTKGELADIGSQRLTECLAPVASEIKKTLHFFEIELKDQIKTILVSGPLAQAPGICDYFKKEFQRDIKKLFIPDLGVDNSPLYAKSYALALYGGSFRSGYLNFRKDEFKYVGADRDLRRVVTVPAVLLAVLILLFIYSSASRYFELKNQVSDIEAQISRVVSETFPNVKVIPRPVEYMDSEVSKVREQMNMIEGVEGASTPLEVLRNISGTLPASMKLAVNDIRFETDKKVKIAGVCDSYQEVADIEEALTKSDIFETVTRNQTGNTVNGKTKFEISLELKPEA